MSRAERRHTEKKSFNWQLWGTLALIVVVVASFAVFRSGKGTGVDYTQYSFADDKFDKPAATKVLEEFSDFQCPACQATSPSIKALRDSAPEDVRVVYKHFPLRSIHPLAQGAAEASVCAGEQNRFWAYHDVLMETKLLKPRELKLHAEGLGLDVAAWEDCLDSGRARTAVDADYREGSLRLVQGTPTIFVNGVVYNGGRTSFDYLQALGANK